MEHITTRLTTSWWRNGSVQVLKLPEPEHSKVQMLEATMTWWWWLSRHALRIQGNQPSQESGLTSNDPTVLSAVQATIGGRFAPLTTLVDEDADLDFMVTHFNKAVTDTATELFGNQRRKRKPWVTPEIIDLCDHKGDLKERRGEPEGFKEDREIKRKIRTETWLQGQCQEVEACLRKNNQESIPASQRPGNRKTG